MIHVATALMFDKKGKLLIYLRDDIPEIPFPNHWDLFGGHVEEGESPEEALVREIEEEIGVHISSYEKFRDYECLEGDAHQNIKHVFIVKTDIEPDDLTLYEGQYLKSIYLSERGDYKFANILAKIIDDYTKSI